LNATRAASTSARFGTWTSPGYTVPKVIENYQMRFSVSYPNEERPAARPFRTTPMYQVFDQMNAVWGQQYGLEVVNYHALPGEPRYEEPTFKRSNAWEATRQEVMAVREGVGINEVQNFGKYLVTGPNARAWLDRIMAGTHPETGAAVADPDAGGKRQDHRRLHRVLPERDRIPADRQLRRAGLASALVRTTCDEPGCNHRECLGVPLRLPDRRAEGARAVWPASPGRMSAPMRSSSWT
jgi:hypothetical protein